MLELKHRHVGHLQLESAPLGPREHSTLNSTSFAKLWRNDYESMDDSTQIQNCNYAPHVCLCSMLWLCDMFGVEKKGDGGTWLLVGDGGLFD